MKYNKEEIIKKLELQPHAEGGYYKEIFLSDVEVGAYKSLSIIYFLLDENNFSAFHKIKFSEVWSFHLGNPLTVVEIENGILKETVLGDELNNNTFIYNVKGGNIFASYVKKGFALVSCFVSPSFDYKDFYLYKREELLNLFPNYKKEILKLTRE
ncbi:MAG: cupin domain-containing protein [Bacillales bacterium]|jgi:predicted cupin superfamily sugar epimerase|nr:cupin domain-containing protein [Bacillales bacterium]